MFEQKDDWFAHEVHIINMLGPVYCIFLPTPQDTNPTPNYFERGQSCQFIGLFWVGLLGLAKNANHFFDKGDVHFLPTPTVCICVKHC